MRHAAIAFVFAASISSVARADTCPAPAGADARLARLDARARIDFLRDTLEAQSRYATTWKLSWVGIGGAIVLASVGEAIGWSATHDAARDARVADAIVVAGFSALLPLVTLVAAPTIPRDARAVSTMLDATNGGAAGTCLVLARMEELFAKGAAEESFNAGPLAHLAAVVGVGALFSILAVEAATSPPGPTRDAHWENAIFNGVGGLALTELQILTSPRGASHAYRRYLTGDLPRGSIAFSVSPMRQAAGVAIAITF